MNNNNIKALGTFALLLLCLNGFNIAQTLAAEKHPHQAHVHGVAHLNVALEDNELYIEFITPAADIVGFEHQPKTEKQKAAVKNAIQVLKAGEKLFVIPSKAGAKLISSEVKSGFESEHAHEEEHHGEHHDEHGDGAHSDFMAVYRFACKNPAELTQMDVKLFQLFKGIESIDVQILTRTKVSAFKLTAKKNRITF